MFLLYVSLKKTLLSASSASCVHSTLHCKLAFKKSIFDFCKSIQNRPRRDASKH